MMSLERIKGFARTAALRDRRSGCSLAPDEFEAALNAYANIDAVTKGDAPRPVPPLFVYTALSIYRAICRRYRNAA